MVLVFRNLEPGRYALSAMHDENGNGKLQLPPEPLERVAVYRQPPPPPRSRRSLVLGILGLVLSLIPVAFFVGVPLALIATALGAPVATAAALRISTE